MVALHFEEARFLSPLSHQMMCLCVATNMDHPGDGRVVIGTGKWSTITRAHKGLLAGKSRTGTGDDIRGSQGRPVRARENQGHQHQGTSMDGHHKA